MMVETNTTQQNLDCKSVSDFCFCFSETLDECSEEGNHQDALTHTEKWGQGESWRLVVLNFRLFLCLRFHKFKVLVEVSPYFVRSDIICVPSFASENYNCEQF